MLGGLLCKLGFHAWSSVDTTARGLTIGRGLDYYVCRRCGHEWGWDTD
jgi:hypothetical protein